MLKLFFRVMLLGLGLFLSYIFGKEIIEPIQFKTTGVQVEGRVHGFVAGRGKGSIQPEATGVRKGKRRARRPAFMYPVAVGSTDSLEGRSSTAALFSNYALNEKVTVVFDPKAPQHAYIFGWQLIFMAILCTLLGLYMVKIGLTGRA